MGQQRQSWYVPASDPASSNGSGLCDFQTGVFLFFRSVRHQFIPLLRKRKPAERCPSMSTSVANAATTRIDSRTIPVSKSMVHQSPPRTPAPFFRPFPLQKLRQPCLWFVFCFRSLLCPLSTNDKWYGLFSALSYRMTVVFSFEPC